MRDNDAHHGAGIPHGSCNRVLHHVTVALVAGKKKGAPKGGYVKMKEHK